MRRLMMVLALLAAPAMAAAQDGWTALAQPGAIAVMRHALAPGTGDPAGFSLQDCATQRNLNDRGRAQAAAIGAALRARDIAVDAVWTSQWCRCRETAELLALAPVTEKPFLNSFFGARERQAEQTEALRAALAALPAGSRHVLVTHQVNITALTGVFPSSGEIVVLGRGAEGALTVTGRIRMDP